MGRGHCICEVADGGCCIDVTDGEQGCCIDVMVL